MRTRDEYLKARKQLAADLGPRELWSVIDPWPLFCGTQNLARNLVLIDALRQTQAVHGDVLEFGAWKGATTLLWAKMLAITGSSRHLHAFDTWSRGLETTQWTAQDNVQAATSHGGAYVGDRGLIEAMLNLEGLTDRVSLHQGRIEHTWPKVRDENPDLRASLVLLDCDLYEPTAAALMRLHERVSLDGLIIADEYGFPAWPGETKAVDEFLAAHPGCYKRSVPTTTPQPSLILQRVV